MPLIEFSFLAKTWNPPVCVSSSCHSQLKGFEEATSKKGPGTVSITITVANTPTFTSASLATNTTTDETKTPLWIHYDFV